MGLTAEKIRERQGKSGEMMHLDAALPPSTRFYSVPSSKDNQASFPLPLLQSLRLLVWMALPSISHPPLPPLDTLLLDLL